MKIKLLITTENEIVISQEISSQWEIQKDAVTFFTNLQKYMLDYIKEYNKKNAIPIKKLQSFTEDDVQLLEIHKN
jgi:hypothetical protein